MTTHEAERDLQVIRTLMERGTRYTTLTASSGITAGLIALVGCAVQWLNPLGLEYRWNFVGTWSLVFIAAALANLYFTAQLARRNGEPTWSRPARTVVCALIPAFVAGVVLSTTLFRIGRIDLLPGTWMLLYGCGALAMSYFTPVVIRVLGIGFMAVGSVANVAASLPNPPGTNMRGAHRVCAAALLGRG